MTTVIEHQGIATVIGTNRLQVPKHQRPFEWTKEEVGELLSDLDSAIGRNQQEYFLGSIVVVAPAAAERYEVLDGQQRLATVCLLLASIADSFAKWEEVDAAAAVRQLLTSYDIDQGAHTPHVRLNHDDDPFFRGLLAETYPAPAAGAPESHALLHRAREQTKAWVQAKTGEKKTALDWLKLVTKYLRESVRVIYFRVPDDANAYLIFETLNDRGLDLSIADLLKNYLLGRAEEDVDSVLALWTKTHATLKAFGYEKNFAIFLRHYWASKHEVVREKALYRDIKGRIVSKANVVDFAGDLQKNSYYYAAVVSAEHEYWSTASDGTRERLRTLTLLGLEQYRPMLLAALAHFDVKDVETVIALLEAWNVRLIVVGTLGGGVMEAKYAELGRSIRGGEIKNVAGLAAAAQKFVPGDIQFKGQFAVATASKVALARYYLRKLQITADGTSEMEKVPNPGLTLEHVLPEQPAGNYPQFTEEEKRLYTRRIGNMSLLTHKLNSDAKSAPFSEKKETYKKSTLTLTGHLADISEWNVSEIEKRQLMLSELALKTWPFKK